MFRTSLIDEFFKGWNRPVMEVKGWKSIPTDNGYVIIANTLGIEKKDIKINLDGKTLTLEGKTEVKEIDFTNTVKYRWDLSNLITRIENIEYEVKNGLVYIDIFTSEKQKQIAIKQR